MPPRNDKPYKELGKLLDAMARKRDVRGPYAIAKHLKDVSGYSITGQAVSRYFHNGTSPKPAFLQAFATGFGLSEDERDRLAWVYTYGVDYSDAAKLAAEG